MSQERLGVVDFGRRTIKSGDLDPLYIGLNGVGMSRPQLARWLLGYWCLYHAGLASWLSDLDEDKFWDMLMAAALNQPGTSPVGSLWPRGKERRHWRGAAATSSALAIAKRYETAGDLLNFLVTDDPAKGADGLDPAPIMRRTQTLPGFGPWIAFKVADMLDAVGLRSLDFSQAAVFMFDQPQQAAIMAWRSLGGFSDLARPKDPALARDNVVRHLLTEFSDLACPHQPSRGIRLQEVETVLCKWKSHVGGSYPVGNDIGEIGDGLEEWAGESATAAELHAQVELLS